MDFYMRHDVVPVVDGICWRRTTKQEFKNVMCKLGDPVYEYKPPMVKTMLWTRERANVSLTMNKTKIKYIKKKNI